jgi:hypothetical protein
MYHLTRLKSNLIVRDSGTAFSLLTRDSVKKIALALGQNSSFCRGFDKILHMLLVSIASHFLYFTYMCRTCVDAYTFLVSRQV